MSSTPLRSAALYTLFLVTVSILVVELAMRAYFTTKVGPRVFLYGTDYYRNIIAQKKESARKKWLDKYYQNRTVELHRNTLDQYSKFFPNENKVDQDVDTGEVINVTINSHGFRGEEFAVDKGDAVRVLTLGASSTFGYYNRDETTYPHYLEEVLNQECGEDKKFEVINLGIPHLTSAMILALLSNEGFDLDPDVITIYSGSNDSQIPAPAPDKGTGEKIYDRLKETLLTVHYVDHMFAAKESGEGQSFDPEYAAVRSRVFLENLDAIRMEAEHRNILLVVANQQRKSMVIDRNELQGITYEQEVDLVRKKFDRGEPLSKREVSFLIHKEMMDDLRVWTDRHNVPFVDVLDLLDQERHLLLSWVHLHAQANKKIGKAFADEIVKRICSG